MANPQEAPRTPIEMAREAGLLNLEPFVENARLPRMAPLEGLAALAPVAGRSAMPANLKADGGGRGRSARSRASRMEPVPSSDPGRGGALSDLMHHVTDAGLAAHPDQVKAAGPVETQPEGQGYVRLHVRYENGALTILDAKEVDGPLIVPDTLGSGFAYEVTVDNRRIGLGNLPDANMQRSFTNIDRPEAALGHGITPLKTFDFSVRIARQEVQPAALPNIRIALHNLTEAPSGPLGPSPLRAQLGNVAGEVASLQGIDVERLTQPAQTVLRRILGTGP